MAEEHGSSIKDDDRYEALREQGMSKEKAERIANTPPDEMEPRGGDGARRTRSGPWRSSTTRPQRWASRDAPT